MSTKYQKSQLTTVNCCL